MSYVILRIYAKIRQEIYSTIFSITDNESCDIYEKLDYNLYEIFNMLKTKIQMKENVKLYINNEFNGEMIGANDLIFSNITKIYCNTNLFQNKEVFQNMFPKVYEVEIITNLYTNIKFFEGIVNNITLIIQYTNDKLTDKIREAELEYEKIGIVLDSMRYENEFDEIFKEYLIRNVVEFDNDEHRYFFRRMFEGYKPERFKIYEFEKDMLVKSSNKY